MGIRSAVTVSAVLACTLLSGCGITGDDTSGGCASVHGDVETLKAKVEQSAADVKALGPRPRPKLVDGNWATGTPGRVDDSAGQAWDTRRQGLVEQIKTTGITMAHVVVDHPSCFTDLQVASAKTALGSQ